ncbi:MAG: AAA family ATPase [Elainella sp.]
MERSESADVAVQYLEQALKACQSHVTLTNVQLVLLQRSWANCSYREIAEELAYEYDYVKQLGAQVWQLLSQATGQKVTKSNVQAVLTRLGRQSNWTEPPPALQCDWGEATDVSVFFGREQELETLCQWVEGVGQAGEAWEEQPCRLMTLLGMGGIGKTALAVRLAEQLTGISRWGKSPVEPVVSTFRALCWKSLRDAPTLNELLTTLLKSLAPQSPIPETTSGQLSQLLQVLQTQRCLIVLDNFDALLEAGTTGSYRQDRQDYGELLRCLGEVPHQSCVVITSREKPEELLALAGDAVRVVQLQGLTEASG